MTTVLIRVTREREVNVVHPYGYRMDVRSAKRCLYAKNQIHADGSNAHADRAALLSTRLELSFESVCETGSGDDEQGRYRASV